MKAGASALTFMTMSELLRRSGQGPAKQATIEGEHTAMSYDIEDFGGIGADVLSAIAGDDEDLLEALAVSGTGSSEIIGADPYVIGAAVQKAAAKRAVQAAVARRGAAVVDRGVSKRRKMPIGFAPTDITASSSATIPGAPQNLFRIERLIIGSDICYDVGVSDMKVGNQSQFAQSNEVPGVIFSEAAINTGVEFDTAEVGNQVSLLLRNKDTVNTLTFCGAAIGTVAK
jgi:hypothetical protein